MNRTEAFLPNHVFVRSAGGGRDGEAGGRFYPSKLAPHHRPLSPPVRVCSGSLLYANAPPPIESPLLLPSTCSAINNRQSAIYLPSGSGPNDDATLNRVASQNETTVYKSTNDQIVIARTQRLSRQPQTHVYLSTNGGTTWTNYAIHRRRLSIPMATPPTRLIRGGYAYFSNLGYINVLRSLRWNVCQPLQPIPGRPFSAPIRVSSNFLGGGIAIFHDKIRGRGRQSLQAHPLALSTWADQVHLQSGGEICGFQQPAWSPCQLLAIHRPWLT